MSGGRADRRLVAANWKMHLLRSEAVDFCRVLLRELPPEAPRIVIFPSFPLLPAVAETLAGSAVALGGQDLHPKDQGAHTGDVSGTQLADAGCTWALCGHSERRRDHAEGDDLVASKVAAAARHGLTPLVCVGETREQRRGGQTLAVIERQLRAALASGPDPVAVAYEPVWAIGTGETATPDTAEEAHAFLRRLLSELRGGAAGRISVLYGGSVTPDNAAGLIAQPDVDGFLVGGASLDPWKFLSIIRGSI